jgi:hypothetical protein
METGARLGLLRLCVFIVMLTLCLQALIRTVASEGYAVNFTVQLGKTVKMDVNIKPK